MASAPKAEDSFPSLFQGVAVSLTANTVTVKGSGKTAGRSLEFVIPSDAKITRNGQGCALKSVRRGDSVEVVFTAGSGGSRQVTELRVGTPTAAQ